MIIKSGLFYEIHKNYYSSFRVLNKYVFEQHILY